MRKFVALEFISLDGVVQAPGGEQEDTSNGFEYGGWTYPLSDEFAGEAMSEQMSMPFDLLLGRKTYDIFASYWPFQENQIGNLFNKAIKYVVSHDTIDLSWDKSILVKDNVVETLKKLRNEDGPILQIYGSSDLVQTLLKNDLIDELWLKIFPVTLGNGKRLFGEGTIPVAFELAEFKVSPMGVIFASYKRAGEVKTGTFE
ncbi:MAG: dihydrofolate reductase family protein [Acidimicrobiia bacterium]